MDNNNNINIENKYSRGIKIIGLEKVIKVAKKYLCNNICSVEVGSGNGYFAKILEEVGINPIITIDPLNYYFNGQPDKEPDFPSIDKFITSHSFPGMKNTNLILNWPSPRNYNNETQSWDLEAILKLKPQIIFLIYASCGTSGSLALLEWLKIQNRYIIINIIKRQIPASKTFNGTYPIKIKLLVLQLIN